MKKNMMSIAIRNKIGAKKWTSIRYFLIAIPFLMFIFAFSYVPLFGWLYSFFEYKMGKSFYDVEWVGLKFILKLFNDRETGRVMRNTLIMSLGGLILSPLPAIVAILLNDIKNAKVQKFTQTVITFPNFISWIIVFGLAQALFSSNGMWNQLLKIIGLPYLTYGLIGDTNSVWGFQLALGVWKSIGWNSIIYLAAITGIDAELYDAAKVDGADKVRQIKHITIPGILPTYLVLLLMSVGNILSNGFEQYYVFWNNIVANKIEVLDYYIYKVGMKSFQYSYSVAVGMLKSLVGIILLFLTNWISKKVRGNTMI